MKNKLLTALLVALLCASLLMGCTSSGNSTPPPDAATTTDASTATPAADGDAVKPEAPGEMVELRFIAQVHELSISPEEQKVFRDLTERTNVKVNFETIQGPVWNDKKATILASGDMPDAFFTDGITDADIMANKSLFQPINEYLDNCPNIQRMYEEEPQTKMLATFPDGSIYMLTQVLGYRPNSTAVTMINKNWLDALNLSMPTTLSELKDVLIAFRDKDPNGNNQKDEIPIDWQNQGFFDGFSIQNLLGAWGITDTGARLYISDDGKIQPTYMMDEYKQLVMYCADLWKEGLVNPEVFTQDYTMFQSTAQYPDNPIVGFTFGWQISNRVGKWADQYVAMAPMRADGYDGPLYYSSNPVGLRMSASRFVMCANNKDPEATMRYMDACYEPEMTLQLCGGDIGKSYEVVNDGQYKYRMTRDTGDLDIVAYLWTNSIYEHAPFYFSRKLEKEVDVNPDFLVRLDEDKVTEPFIRDIKTVMPPYKYEAEESSEIAMLRADIDPYIGNQFATWVSGGDRAKVEQDWDAYIDTLKKMNVDRLMAIFQNAYDQYYAGN